MHRKLTVFWPEDIQRMLLALKANHADVLTGISDPEIAAYRNGYLEALQMLARLAGVELETSYTVIEGKHETG